MRPPKRRLAALATAFAVVCSAAAADRPAGPAKRKVLVELFTSQGCDSCPAAETLLGRLRDLGYGPDRVVPVAFHVDYFNTPWKDRFSDHEFSKRQYEYSLIHQRENGTNDPNYLYFTPMLMVDGRTPMLGSDRTKAQAALKRATAEKPGASIAAKLEGSPDDPRRKTLSAEVAAVSLSASGRDLLVGVAVVEDSTSTKVGSGENSGKTLREHHAVRRFVYQKVRLTGAKSKSVSFPLTLADGCDPEGCSVAVFVQDWKDGRVHQAESLRWAAAGVRKGARPVGAASR